MIVQMRVNERRSLDPGANPRTVRLRSRVLSIMADRTRLCPALMPDKPWRM